MAEVIKVMNKTDLVAEITVDYRTEKVMEYTKYSDNRILLPFTTDSAPTWADFEEFLESRCFAKSNGQKKNILRSLELDYFSPWHIVHINNGRNFDDHQWLKFENEEDMTYERILLRERDS